MALYNFSQIRKQVGQYLGIVNSNNPDFTADTSPPLELVNKFINDSLRETMSEFNYRQVESSCRVPFNHFIYNVNGAYLTGLNIAQTTGIQANFMPFPGDNLLINCQVPVPNYSGIAFQGTDLVGISWSGISTGGSGTVGSIETVGYQYELPPYVEQIYSITVPLNSLKLTYMPQYDFDRMIPQGLTISSGTPSYYTQFPGMSSSGNLVVQFYPEPVAATYSGVPFVVHYRKKHMDMTEDTDIQHVLPEQFQDIIFWGALERSYMFKSDTGKMAMYAAKKESRTGDLKLWAENHLDYVYTARDGDFLSSDPNSAYNTSVLFRL